MNHYNPADKFYNTIYCVYESKSGSRYNHKTTDYIVQAVCPKCGAEQRTCAKHYKPDHRNNPDHPIPKFRKTQKQYAALLHRDHVERCCGDVKCSHIGGMVTYLSKACAERIGYKIDGKGRVIGFTNTKGEVVRIKGDKIIL